VQLPPVRLRLAEEIRLTKPEAGASVDLRDAELRWSAVPDADHYLVNLLYTAETPTPTHLFFLSPKTNEPRLRFAQLSDQERRQIRENYVPGRTAGWRVDAYDAAGKRIGVSLSEQQFLIVHGLDSDP
jgi:hypothetical protein